ncbi:MAG: hypothetical protein ACKVU2_18480 [Saprospiraceae bacterium]
MQRTTIKDLARQFGVNPLSLIRALAKNPDVGFDRKNNSVPATGTKIVSIPTKLVSI